MNPDILTALRALGDADRVAEASPDVERKLRGAFRRKQRARIWKRAAVWSAAVAAALVAMIAAYERQHEPKQIAQPVRHVAVEAVEAPVLSVSPMPVRKAARPRRREMVTEFFPLLDGAPPVDRGELLRVRLPASAMRAVGLPVPEDRLADPVQADVLISEDGLATAIRFVKTSQ